VKIFFLDQSGKSGGAELCLLDVASAYRDRCLVGLFEDGSFRVLLEQNQLPVQILSRQPIQVRKESSWITGLSSLGQLLPLVARVVRLSPRYDVIYANTQKALVVGALASFLSRRPLVYHLHDILSIEHFSPTNRRIAVTLANQFASAVMATSRASRDAFVEAGGRFDRTRVVYNGFQPEKYVCDRALAQQLRTELGLNDRFVIGHFSRLSPWKGQHILIEALTHCPAEVTAVFVGDALYGEEAYVQEIRDQVEQLGLGDRVRFLGFRSDVVPLMSLCDLITHTSISAEPFGRVIAEAMLCGKPVIAAKEGGALELIDHGENGWLVPPGDPQQLAQMIHQCRAQWEETIAVSQRAQQKASQHFHLNVIKQQIHQLLEQVVMTKGIGRFT
jgi:glycosyltransferase involved in cell wall biosynthesis